MFSLNYSKNRIDFTAGGGWNKYDGEHYGEVIWARFAGNSNIRQRYYENDADKKDFNLYGKLYYQLNKKLNAFVDVQYRNIQYSFLGFNNNLDNVQEKIALNFFNPKAGFTYQINPNSSFYTSYSIAHREPNRNDYTETSINTRPKAEMMGDLEAGYKFNQKAFAFSLNYYWMDYKNELVLTGQINDVGEYTRTNIDRSYRMGIEAELAIKPATFVQWNINATFSQNKILDFKEYLDDYDNGGQVENQFSKSDLPFSPNIIVGSQLEFKPVKNLSLALLSKYVGKQYMDNTSNDTRKLDAYFVNDIRLNYSIKPNWMKELNFSLLVNNILSEKYESNGYTYAYIYGNQRIDENFYFPQAGINFLLAVGLKF